MGYQYDFDTVIDRTNTNSIKYDFSVERKGRNDLIPLWVADMDFPLPENVLADVISRVEHGIFGYTDPKDNYFDVLKNWFHHQYNWDIKGEWNTITPGVVYAIIQAIRAFTKEGDSVIIQQPVYYPFAESIIMNQRKMVNNQLAYENGKYTMDYEDFEEKIIRHNVKLFILCNPHNPVGRVWTRGELLKLGEICLRHNVLVVADEIHCDFVYPGHQYTPFASLSEELAAHTITCTSASKTFNVAGLQIANILISNEKIRKQFQFEVAASGFSQVNTIGLAATHAVYEKGEEWLIQLKEYLYQNLQFVREFLHDNIPQISLVEPEGTYLIWLDFSRLGLSYKELERLIVDKAKLWLDAGIIFGKETALFERINIACPRSILKQALEQLAEAVNTID